MAARAALTRARISQSRRTSRQAQAGGRDRSQHLYRHFGWQPSVCSLHCRPLAPAAACLCNGVGLLTRPSDGSPKGREKRVQSTFTTKSWHPRRRSRSFASPRPYAGSVKLRLWTTLPRDWFTKPSSSAHHTDFPAAARAPHGRPSTTLADSCDPMVLPRGCPQIGSSGVTSGVLTAGSKLGAGRGNVDEVVAPVIPGSELELGPDHGDRLVGRWKGVGKSGGIADWQY